MRKQEGALKSALMAELMPRMPGAVIQSMASAGSPDRSISWAGRTTHWEFKHATPTFVSPGLQELLCNRLAAVAHCRYVVWWQGASGIGKRTMIVHPREILERKSWLLVPEEVTPGFDHVWLAERIKEAHEYPYWAR